MTLAVESPMPSRSVSVPSAARSASSAGSVSRTTCRAPHEGPRPVAGVVGAVQAVHDALHGLGGGHGCQARGARQHRRDCSGDPPGPPRRRPHDARLRARAGRVRAGARRRHRHRGRPPRRPVRSRAQGLGPPRRGGRRGGRSGRVVPELLDVDGPARHLARRPLRAARAPRQGARSGAAAVAGRGVRRAGLPAVRVVGARLEPAVDRALPGHRRGARWTSGRCNASAARPCTALGSP